jgi:predicted LPLAT superfamily acyltransferase
VTGQSNQNKASWLTKKERSNMLMLRTMTWISLKLGRQVGRVVLHLIASYFLLFAPSSRRASKQYLARALGRKVRIADQYQHFYTFASTIHDRIYLINQRFDLFNIKIEGEDIVHRHLKTGNGMFLAGAHLGSFEIIRALGRDENLRVAMFMHQENAKKINAMLTAINPSAGQDIIGLGNVDSMIRVSEYLDEGYAIGILADRIFSEDTLQPVQILGTETHLPVGPFRLAALLKQKVMFMTGLYLGGNNYSVHFHQLADFSNLKRGQRDDAVKAAIVEYAALIDHYCKTAPYNWFNFFDFWQPALKKDE